MAPLRARGRPRERVEPPVKWLPNYPESSQRTLSDGMMEYTVTFKPGVVATSVSVGEHEEHDGESAGDDRDQDDNHSVAQSVNSAGGGTKKSRRAKLFRYQCPKTHRDILRDKVYRTKCVEAQVRANTGVCQLVTLAEPCFCRLYILSLRNLFLGDRGIVALVPLLEAAQLLKCVNVAGNGIRHYGFEALAAGFGDPDVHTDLRVVDLSDNPISAKSLELAKGLIRAKPMIVLFGLSRTDIVEEEQRVVWAELDINAGKVSTDDLDEALVLADGTSGEQARDAFQDTAGVERLQAIVARRKKSAQGGVIDVCVDDEASESDVDANPIAERYQPILEDDAEQEGL
eukprot:CAMPEP_0204276712 /NCGR_PEP_ID=MMETSP0468-20130131/28680_1 /ASSEMBLY_ACC=CAM_ASM_000383 /TAXON_ID=2969 /ORGANISM="Oxyrrhis marina" /LENGTH=343 /DNA_ID=CAMNT_0051253387 /DNA_START=13 /DNA_END=1044 /DNA_ORIENTATION=-